MKIKFFLLVSALVLGAAPLRASSDYLMEIDGIKGESVDATFKDAIEISSFSWGASNPSSVGAGGMSAGKVSISSFNFMKRTDRSSPVLMVKCATGTHIASAILHVRIAGATKPVEYYKITLSDCLVTGIASAGNQDDDRPTEQFSFSFGKIKVEYTPQTSDGSVPPPVVFTWDVVNNIP